ncbi:hypothetical protein [Streptomyces sp. NPDC056987]|uniref:hypothetical protein n=1 Tax=Streptomyces sp. NPDC056987 TaxID=3345988 RepID=UPI003639AF59
MLVEDRNILMVWHVAACPGGGREVIFSSTALCCALRTNDHAEAALPGSFPLPHAEVVGLKALPHHKDEGGSMNDFCVTGFPVYGAAPVIVVVIVVVVLVFLRLSPVRADLRFRFSW